MKNIIFIILFLLPIFAFSQIEDSLTNIFKVKDTIILAPLNEISRVDLPKEIVHKYICETKNRCMINYYNNRPYFYYPLSYKEFNKHIIISILRTDNYKEDIYLVSICKESLNPIGKLHVFSSIYPNIHSTMSKKSIEIIRKLKVECVDDKKDCIKSFKSKFKLNKKFDSFSKNNNKKMDLLEFEN